MAQCQSAIKDLDHPIEIITFGRVEGLTSVDDIFEDDGSSIFLNSKSQQCVTYAFI